jgi:hypothetical protein
LIGHPLPYPFYPSSSGNLLHHAYHIAKFEENIRINVNEIKLVFEFGGGYGSMCRLFHNLGFRGKYVIFDLPHFSALQMFYLKSIGLMVHPSHTLTVSAGVSCISDLGQLRDLLSHCIDKDNSMFVATWSISETPIYLRQSILQLVADFSAFLIGYQHQFGEVDNLDFFENWRDSFATQFNWYSWQIQHIPANSYLFGKRLAMGH